MSAWDFVLVIQYLNGDGIGVGADVGWTHYGYLGVGGGGHENGDGDGAGLYVGAFTGGGESGGQPAVVGPSGILMRRSEP